VSHDEKKASTGTTTGVVRKLAVGTAVCTAVTFPTAGLLLREKPSIALAVGLAPLAPIALITAAFVALYVTIALLSIVRMATYMYRRDEDPAESLNHLFAWCVNAPIAFLTLKPLSHDLTRGAEQDRQGDPLAAPDAAAAQGALAMLPPVDSVKVQDEDTPVYWVAFQHRAAQAGGAPDVVPSTPGRSSPVTPVSSGVPPRKRGRHAKPENTQTTVAMARAKVRA
jgi:hypothetical protein